MEYSAKGKFYQVKTTKHGRAVLTPVEGLPSHIIEQREREQKVMQVQRNRTRATSMNIGFVLFLSIALIVGCIACYKYISVSSRITANMKQIGVLEDQIEEAAAENDNLQKRIDVAENVNEIRETALAMGMKLPQDSQIVTYSVSDNDYMIHYGK